MVKKKTPGHLKKAREELLPFFEQPPEQLLRDAYSSPEPLPEGVPLPPPTAQGWPRIDPLLAGLEGVIPPERFAAINDKLQSIDALTIMVQNLQETSRADVLATAARAAGGKGGGRGHKRDGSGSQATDDEIDAALEQSGALGRRKQVKTVVTAEQLKVDQGYYRAKEMLDKGDTKALHQDLYEMQAAQLRYRSQLISDDAVTQKTMQMGWLNTSNQIAGAFRNSFNSIIFQGQTTTKAMASFAESIAESMIDMAIEHPKEVWLAAEALKKGVSLSTVLGISAANTTGAVTDIATDKTKTAALVADAAAVAGAQGTASFAGAPWPVDMGAPAFGAMMAAEAAAFGSVASAAGGWDRVPVDDAPALLHRNEMVLPANLAERVRGMTEPASGDVHHHHYNIQAWDGRSMKDTLRRNPHLLADAAMHAKRQGY